MKKLCTGLAYAGIKPRTPQCELAILVDPRVLVPGVPKHMLVAKAAEKGGKGK